MRESGDFFRNGLIENVVQVLRGKDFDEQDVLAASAASESERHLVRGIAAYVDGQYRRSFEEANAVLPASLLVQPVREVDELSELGQEAALLKSLVLFRAQVFGDSWYWVHWSSATKQAGQKGGYVYQSCQSVPRRRLFARLFSRETCLAIPVVESADLFQWSAATPPPTPLATGLVKELEKDERRRRLLLACTRVALIRNGTAC